MLIVFNTIDSTLEPWQQICRLKYMAKILRVGPQAKLTNAREGKGKHCNLQRAVF